MGDFFGLFFQSLLLGNVNITHSNLYICTIYYLYSYVYYYLYYI